MKHSYSVTQRTREVGIRRALGAQNGEVAGMFVRQAVLLAVIGIAFRVAAALAAVRFMSSLLFNVTATDPITYVGVALILALATIAAAYIPALRATGVNRVDALRSD